MPAAPPPISQYILKVHSRCDLACDHCYMYEHADQSWQRRPRAIAPETVAAAGRRIAEHAEAHRLSQVHVVLHGGEPLLLGPRRLRAVLEGLHRAVSPVTTVRFGMQSNGVRLTEEFCRLLLEYGVRVGVSLDGDAYANDLHRRFADGRTSHPQVVRALNLLRRNEFRPIYGGILCTVDIRADPIRVYEALMEHEPPRIDFLLPHATWDTPPLRPDGVRTPYADWLMRVHERWRHDGMPVSIRLFESLEALANGGRSDSEALGLDPADLVVIETDGAWEQVDSLKVAYDGAAATELTVFEHSVDRVAHHPGVAARLRAAEHLSAECRACSVVRQCGGGLYAHRYKSGSGFDNPSVYCPDLLHLVTSLHKGVRDRLAAPVTPITPEILADLATGRGAPATIDALAAGQLALVRSLLAAIGRRIARAGATARSGWVALNALHGYADPVLSHPFVRTWAVRCLGRLRAGSADDAEYLASIAAAVAVRSGANLSIEVPAPGGTAVLPSAGRLTVPDRGGRVQLSISDGDVSVPGGRPDWRPVRHVTVAGATVALEDDRLSAEDERACQATLEAAWALIERDAPGHLSAAAALRAVAPAPPWDRGQGTEVLADRLVEQLQRVKLGAVLDYVDLAVPAAEAALHDTYAHLGVADLYRSRAARAPESAARYRTFRQWTLDGIAAMLASGGLTPMGTRFVDLMAQTVHSWGIPA